MRAFAMEVVAQLMLAANRSCSFRTGILKLAWMPASAVSSKRSLLAHFLHTDRRGGMATIRDLAALGMTANRCNTPTPSSSCVSA
jgi:hypothetical protein